MKYTLRVRHHDVNGSFSVLAADAREALDFARGMIERGVQDLEILDENDRSCDLADLERVAPEAEGVQAG